MDCRVSEVCVCCNQIDGLKIANCIVMISYFNSKHLLLSFKLFINSSNIDYVPDYFVSFTLLRIRYFTVTKNTKCQPS